MKTLILVGMITAAVGVTAFKVRNTDKVDANGTISNGEKQKLVNFLKALETDAKGPLNVINPKKYIQHNLNIANGLQGFKAFVQTLPEGETKVYTVRLFQDGDFIFAHSEYNVFGPKVGFDIFRFENRKIVKHWDNLQELQKPKLSIKMRRETLAPKHVIK